MTKYVHSGKAEKFSSIRKFPTHAQVWGLPPTWGMSHVPWLYGKWNYEQCFPAGNEGRKSYTKQRVDIIGEFWPVFFFGRNFANWLTKIKSPVRSLQMIFLEKFQKYRLSKISPYFLEKNIKFARFRQWVRVARQDFCRIQKKLYCPPCAVAI